VGLELREVLPLPTSGPGGPQIWGLLAEKYVSQAGGKGKTSTVGAAAKN